MEMQYLMELFFKAASQPGRDNSMPGNRRYWSDQLAPYLGYDQWALWLTVVEIQWLFFLQKIGYAPDLKKYLEEWQIEKLLNSITTTEQDIIERQPGVGHDINALIRMMKRVLPKKVHPFIHHGLTSYDAINCAEALRDSYTFKHCFWPQIMDLDKIWRGKIGAFAETVQMGRTHLQHALPVTVGFWLAVLHNRYANTANQAQECANQSTGKISGATGTSAALVALGIIGRAWHYDMCTNHGGLEGWFLHEELQLGNEFQNGFANPCDPSTQIVSPEKTARFYHELVLLSGALANLGEDARILQSSDIGEIISVGSTSSTMAHKTANPITAENMAGMHTTVIAEYLKVMQHLVSDLQRDLRGSSPRRDFPAIMVYVFKQITSATKLLEKMDVNPDRLRQNFERSQFAVMGELLYLALAKAGLEDAHTFVNKVAVPALSQSKVPLSLTDLMELRIADKNPEWLIAAEAWSNVPLEIKDQIHNPQTYLGLAVKIAKREADNGLEPLD